MSTPYRATLEELYARAARGIDPGLERMRRALDALDHPERAFEVAHVAGTNGKGSTARMISAGWGGGLFTSPHLHSLTERFRVDGAAAERAAVVEAWRAITPAIADVPLTFFETVTLLAFEVFRQAGVARVVLEVGLGGRLDSTNVIERPRVCVITPIGLDHTAMLGADLTAIAGEKAGILRPGVPCVVASQDSAVDAVLERTAAELGAPLLRPSLHDDFTVRLGERVWSGRGPRLDGAHQRQNAALAVAAMWTLGLGDDVIARGLDATWPGRLETIDGVLLDAAHNPDGARALAAHLAGGPEVTLVFGAMRDKAHAEMLAILRPRAAHVLMTAADLERSADPASLAGPGDRVVPSVAGALRLAGSLGPPVVVAGSIFVVAEARAELLGIEGDPPIAM